MTRLFAWLREALVTGRFSFGMREALIVAFVGSAIAVWAALAS